MRRTSRHHPAAPPPRPPPLGGFIRRSREVILRDWEAEVRRLPIASDLDRPALIDHLPELLENLADMADDCARAKRPPAPDRVTHLHALQRLGEGYDLPQIVHELSLLRACITRRWERELQGPKRLSDLHVLDQVIDTAIAASIRRVAEARDRTLRAIDRIANEALDSTDLDDLLGRLVTVLVETTENVDTVAILIREGDRLRVRATRGLEAEIEGGFSLAIGEGFTGKIAAERRPAYLTSAATDPLVRSEVVRARGVQALYGVPLIDEGNLIGVAHMGSTRVSAFSHEEQLVFATFANRASAAIYQSMLHEQAETAAAELAAVVESLPAAVYIATASGLARTNRAGAALLGAREAGELVGRPAADLLDALDARDPATGMRLSPDRSLLAEALRGGAVERDMIVRDRGEDRDVTVHAIAAPIVRDARVIGAVTLAFDVTARRRVEHALRERELEFRTIAENLPQLTWIADPGGDMIWFNHRWEELTGATVGELLGEGWRRVHHPDHVARVTAKLGAAIASGEPWEDMFPLRARDGHYRWFLGRAVPVRDDRGEVVRWFGTNTDITERRVLDHAAAVLAASLDLDETLARIAAVAVPDLADWCVVDILEGDRLARVAIEHADAEKREAARAWGRRFPPEPDRPAGIAEVLRTGQPVLFREVTDEIIAANSRGGEYPALLRSLGIASCLVAPITARGKTLGALTLVHAESGRHYGPTDIEAAVELGRRAGLAIDNARLYEQAQDAVHAREEMLAIVSHDLRNPLGSIHLAASLILRSDDVAARTRKHVEIIHRSARRMEVLLGDLLDTASLQVGRFTIEREPVRPADVLAEVVEVHEELARTRAVRITLDQDLAGVTLAGDRKRLAQALGNLIGNAIKFSPEGDEVILRGRADPQQLQLSVEDHGPGISGRELPHIFDPYWSGTRHAAKGTGLGLYICKGIIEAHGGTIAVQTTPGEGSTFTVTLPRQARK
jgi:PAS domain S-box-containing protein